MSTIAVVLAATVATLTPVTAVTAVAAGTAGTARPGAADVGDYLFPGLGNGGYDVQHYDLDLRYPTAESVQPVHGTVTMKATATQDLSSFNLDFAGDQVAGVRVNGRPARFDWQQSAEELVITPAKALCRGRTFTVEVAFTSHTTAPEPDNLYPVGWIANPNGSGSFTSFQPDTAHQAIPVNDHPSDKATWRFALDVPRGVTAVTNGIPTGQRTTADRTAWTYEERSPLATELIQLAGGEHLEVVQRGTVAGVTYRDVITQSRQDLFEPAFAHGPSQLAWVIDQVGRFPDGIYGNLGVDLRFGYALESDDLSLQSVGLFDPTFVPGRTGQEWFYSSVMVHEIAHEYFGNSVSPARWSDLWLNEGWAVWIMKQWEQEKGTIDEWGNPSLEDYMREVYAQGDIWRAEFGPVARPRSADTLFSPNVYDGGALVLFALQQKVGEETFRAIQRGWAKRFRGGSVSTDDFIAYASRVAKQDLSGFLRAWLYGDTTPAMPGHPDWTVNPETAAAVDTQATHAGGRMWQPAA